MLAEVTLIGYQEVEKVYSSIRLTGVTISTWSIAVVIAGVLVVNNFRRDYMSAITDSQKPGISQMINLSYKGFQYMAIIILMPLAFTLIENILSAGEQVALKKIGVSPMGIYKALSAELAVFEKDHQGIDFWDPVYTLVDFFVIVLVKPTIAALDQYLYSGAVVFRFIYLLLLEMVAPVAIACLLDKDTKVHFYTWVKNMTVCYLMVPGFMIANMFCEGIRLVMGKDGRTTALSLLLVAFLKFGAYKWVANKLLGIL